MNKPLLIIDLEATCWKERNPDLKNEIIEIGCAIVSGKEIIFNQSWFVKPILNPILSDFCKELTSITQDQIDTAQSFPEVMQIATNEIEKTTNCKISDLLFISWGNYDKNQFLFDCALHNIPYPFGEHFNLKEYFRTKYKTKNAGVKNGLHTLKLQFQGTHHRGKDDALNIARIYIELDNPNPMF